jgi:thioredoxin-like negative regulator of GroEL
VLGLVLALCVLTHPAAANGPDAPAQLLKRADGVKMINYAAFAAIVESLEGKSAQLQSADRDYLRYLEGWRKGYDGDYAAAVTALEKLASETAEATLRFRARTTVTNVLVLEARYEQAFSLLSGLLEQLTQISDGDAREQALVVAGQLYNEVAQYDLTLTYAQRLIDENWEGAGLCKGASLKLPALYESGRIKTPGPEWQAGIDACTRLGLLAHADVIRMYGIKRFIEQGRMDEALAQLKEHYEEVLGTRYPRLISAYDAMLAQVYLNKGDVARARQFASNAVQKAVKKQYTEPIVTGYRVLYELAKQRGDFKAALAFHEEYAAADKAYLDDLSARHLAYQKVNHENIANKLQVEALNKQNHVLQLERALSAKAMETSRLYIVLLTMTIVFIALWAYRTKRSQLHYPVRPGSLQVDQRQVRSRYRRLRAQADCVGVQDSFRQDRDLRPLRRRGVRRIAPELWTGGGSPTS